MKNSLVLAILIIAQIFFSQTPVLHAQQATSFNINTYFQAEKVTPQFQSTFQQYISTLGHYFQNLRSRAGSYFSQKWSDLSWSTGFGMVGSIGILLNIANPTTTTAMPITMPTADYNKNELFISGAASGVTVYDKELMLPPPPNELYVGVGQQYETISDALVDAMSGYTIYVNKGTYREGFEIPEGVQIKSIYGPEDTTIELLPLSEFSITGIEMASNTSLEGFSLARGSLETSQFIVLQNEAMNVVIRNNDLEGDFEDSFAYTAIYMSNGGVDNYIEGNYITNFNNGIMAKGFNTTITNNEVHAQKQAFYITSNSQYHHVYDNRFMALDYDSPIYKFDLVDLQGIGHHFVHNTVIANKRDMISGTGPDEYDFYGVKISATDVTFAFNNIQMPNENSDGESNTIGVYVTEDVALYYNNISNTNGINGSGIAIGSLVNNFSHVGTTHYGLSELRNGGYLVWDPYPVQGSPLFDITPNFLNNNPILVQ